ncbi:hypothetical protein [Psychrobacter sp. UBA3480]|uniref:hypothetical protein n=1 Tax=Psychrobacter sp. UBA3480 TaxID=1947350 RepID=UPI0025DFD78A|nr:hypothetical protein [Psychrobacter sp. UBA3480]
MLLMDLFGTGLDTDDELISVQSEITRLKRQSALLSMAKGVDGQKLKTIGNLMRVLKKQALVYKINQMSGAIAFGINLSIATLLIVMAMASGRINQDYVPEAFFTTVAIMVASKLLGNVLRGVVLWRTKALGEKITTLRQAAQASSTSSK